MRKRACGRLSVSCTRPGPSTWACAASQRGRSATTSCAPAATLTDSGDGPRSSPSTKTRAPDGEVTTRSCTGAPAGCGGGGATTGGGVGAGAATIVGNGVTTTPLPPTAAAACFGTCGGGGAAGSRRMSAAASVTARTAAPVANAVPIPRHSRDDGGGRIGASDGVVTTTCSGTDGD